MQLSICTFVKNEIRTLENMIRSVMPIAGEIIIVDTGSTDGTKEIARTLATRYLEKEMTDFGDIRNYTLEQATFPWILMLDADETILPHDLNRLIELTAIEEHDIWYLPRHQWDNLEMHPNSPRTEEMERETYPDYQGRLIKNTGNIYFFGKVHEQAGGYISRGIPEDLDNAPHIQHFAAAYRSKEEEQAKLELYSKLKEKE